MKLNVVRIISFFFFIILLVIMAAGMHTYKTALAVKETEKWVQHTREVLFESGEVLSKAQDIVLSTRGYIITDDPPFLQPFIDATKDIDNHFENISNLTTVNIQQLQKLDTLKKLINEAIKLSVRIIKLKKQKKFVTVQQLVIVRQGEICMDEIRTLIQTIQAEERISLKLLKKAYADKPSKFNAMGLTVGILC